MEAIPLAIVGAGSIGQRHIDVALACDAVSLCAVVEPDQTLRRALTERGLPAVSTLNEVPKAAKAAIIATPTADHAQSAATCLDLGMAVLVEKPIAHTIGHAKTLIAHAAAKDLPLFVGHHRRCHPFLVKARSNLSELGDLVAAQGLWSLRKHDTYFDPPWRGRPGAGPLMTNLSHDVDLLHFLMGDITCVTAITSSKARGLAVEDTASLAFEFASGALGSFVVSDAGLSPWAFEAGTNENPAIAPSGEDYLKIVGTKGALSVPSLTRWAADGAPADWTLPLHRHPGPKTRTVDPLLEQMRRFAHVLQGGEDDVLCTGEQGVIALTNTLAAAYAAKQARPIRTTDVPQDFDGSEKENGA